MQAKTVVSPLLTDIHIMITIDSDTNYFSKITIMPDFQNNIPL